MPKLTWTPICFPKMKYFIEFSRDSAIFADCHDFSWVPVGWYQNWWLKNNSKYFFPKKHKYFYAEHTHILERISWILDEQSTSFYLKINFLHLSKTVYWWESRAPFLEHYASIIHKQDRCIYFIFLFTWKIMLLTYFPSKRWNVTFISCSNVSCISRLMGLIVHTTGREDLGRVELPERKN